MKEYQKKSVSMPKIYNLRQQKPMGVICIDRSTPYGNPFIMGPDGGRDTVCDLFERYAQFRLAIQPDWLKPLHGKDLACWCVPLRCHGHTLLRLANDQQGFEWEKGTEKFHE